MPEKKAEAQNDEALTNLIHALNEDLSREYQAIIAYIVYSNVLSGAQWMNIAAELKLHAVEELQHALIIADQIDYLGGMPTATAKEVKLSDKPEDMIRFDLDRNHQELPGTREAGRSAGPLRPGREAAQDHFAGAGTPARPGHGAGDRCAQSVFARRLTSSTNSRN